ncbi:zinc finger and BTB domain-containing protein 2b [Denticeps clupeoides]|uniref:Zinc finger and BTB domain containing 2b n=1 Tax=Denticeps clupeoides TaxID=299321 RepID=A0AAY4AZ61_9TELE|nr:zinc finger and BTB domain-containing protein 2 [Denticeps clupeoides]
MELANHGLILLQQLNAQREFGFLCDCTVAIGDVFFKAHKAVLAAFSNYFRMLFIHQDSDCVRLKPVDIQPDIFSYLLNMMYTGKLAPQLIDPARLEQGVKFLHAYPLIQEASLASQPTYGQSEPSLALSNSLYGIQISDQQGTLSGCLSAPRQPTPTFDSDVVGSDAKSPRGQRSKSAQLLLDTEAEASTSCILPSVEDSQMDAALVDTSPYSVNATTILHVKPSIMRKRNSFRKHYSCHICGSHFIQRAALREHLLHHTQALLPLVGESSGTSSPMIPAEPSTSEGEEVLRGGSGTGSAATASSSLLVELSDGEQQKAKESPNSELIMPGNTSASLGQSQADTPPPSDIADIDNLEGVVDVEREVKRRKYECSTCGRKFIQKSHWREHMYIHTGKPYRCSACGKSFCRANQAARHVCVSQGAEASYTMVDRQSMELCAAEDGSHLDSLFMGPSGRPYKCNVCEMTFSTPNEVIKHLCFTQGAYSAVGVLGVGIPRLHGDELGKDEGSDSSSGGPMITSIKTEEVLVD